MSNRPSVTSVFVKNKLLVLSLPNFYTCIPNSRCKHYFNFLLKHMYARRSRIIDIHQSLYTIVSKLDLS